jgi:hypothetical protein
MPLLVVGRAGETYSQGKTRDPHVKNVGGPVLHKAKQEIHV